MTQPHPACVAQAHLDTPLGRMLAAATPHGLAGLWFDGQAHHPGELVLPVDPTQPWLAATRTWLEHYWSGHAHASRSAPSLDLHGTAFQRTVWQALLAIAPGHTCSYGQLAVAVGRPQAVRAVGAAVGRNPVSVIVPCHRVVGSAGQLTGYAGGLQRKSSLLDHETASRQHRLIA